MDNIKKLRLSVGLSQEQVAETIGIARSTLSNWENGVSIPDAEMVLKLSKFFNTTVNVIMDTGTIEKSEQEKLLLSIFNTLKPADKEFSLLFLKYLSGR